MVAIYVALSALCLWGAIAWNSIFMLVLSGVWMYAAAMFVLWFIFVVPRDEGSDGDPYS